MFNIVILVILASFVDYQLLLGPRLELLHVPLNLIDIAAIAAIPAVLWPSQQTSKVPPPQASRFNECWLALFALWVFAIMIGYSNHNTWYDICRDLRSPVMLAIAFILTRKYVRSNKEVKALILIIVAGGVFGATLLLLSSLRFAQWTSYLDARANNASTPAVLLAVCVLISMAINRTPLLRSTFLTLALTAIAVIGSVLDLSLTSYLLSILVPATLIASARVQIRRKLLLAFTFCVICIAVAGVAVTADATELTTTNGRIAILLQPLIDLLNPAANYHLEGRQVGWAATIAYLNKWQILIGHGAGTRVFINTGVTNVDEIILGEPTYATYLLNMGIVGVLILLYLQSKFVYVSFMNMQLDCDSFGAAIALALFGYGIVTIIHSLFHNNWMSPQISILYGTLMGITDRYGVMVRWREIQGRSGVPKRNKNGPIRTLS